MTKENVFSIANEQEFNSIALDIFKFQYQANPIYNAYVNHLNIDSNAIQDYTSIPFLPIQFFKTHQIVSQGHGEPQLTFTSSGSTGIVTSKHILYDVSWYEASFRKAFQQFYGEVEELTILALLPSYLERTGSSLIYMVDKLIQLSKEPDSGYFLYNHKDLYQTLNSLKKRRKKTLLIGVTYALLDFVHEFKLEFPDLIVMETGGMKGKRKEMIREEVHELLSQGFGVNTIHSEYGMTELLSQAYSYGNGIFNTPAWMKVLIRDANDPFTLVDQGRTGAINIIDLANYQSCAFIATQDLGRLHADDSFEVLGRFDNADMRGCNLLVQ